eukprot:386817-Alexandrium_andersonii.AAC.1
MGGASSIGGWSGQENFASRSHRGCPVRGQYTTTVTLCAGPDTTAPYATNHREAKTHRWVCSCALLALAESDHGQCRTGSAEFQNRLRRVVALHIFVAITPPCFLFLAQGVVSLL